MKPAGVNNKRITLVINDNQITEEIFLEDVNNIFNSGEVPNLWEYDEKEEIKQDIRDEADKAGFEDQYRFFVSRIRDNLSIVLCLSPVGDKLRKRLRMFPSLVNCCTINWFDPWPEDALLSVAKKFISTIDALKEEEKL